MVQRSKKYREAAEKIDRNNLYTANEAIALLKSMPEYKFDQTVEAVLRLNVDPRKADQLVRGSVNLPNGTGKTAKVLVFARGPKATEALEAGADIVDTAMSPLALGTSHMPTESLVAALQGTDYDTGLDLNQLNVVRAYFNKLREKYIANGQINQKSLGVDANTLLYQVPGGMFSNMLKQLKDAGKEDKLDEVLAEIPRVREDAGYPPLVTPTSQIVGTQAVFNVILGERYKMVTKEFKGLVHGDYGKTPAPIKPEFTKKILGDEQPITCRFADTLAPEMDKLKAEAAKWATQEEDVLTYAMFPQVAPKFFEKRNAKKQGVDGDHVDYTNQSHPV